jgi:flagellar hook-associated protein 3 FlgL
MRVSTSQQYLSGVFSLQQQQFRLNQLQDQLSTMKRVVTPSDDPVAAAQILDTSQAQAVSQQFTTNSTSVQDRLGLSDNTLQKAADLISNMKTLAVQAGNGSMTVSDLQAIQTQFRQQVQDFVSLTNSTDSSGNYMYAGTKTNQPPYVLNMTNGVDIQYQGDTGRAEVQVSPTRSLAVTDPGSDVFGSTSTPPGNVMLASPPAAPNTPDPNAMSQGNELLQAMKRFDQILSTDPNTQTNPSYSTSLSAVLNGFDAGLQTVLTADARVGARMQEASQLENFGGQQNLQYSTIIGHLQDLDIPSAVSDFQQTLNALQATQKTYQQVSQLSLFNYLQ